MSEPAQEYDISLDVSGLAIELADFIDINEEITDTTKTVQVFGTSNNMNNGQKEKACVLLEIETRRNLTPKESADLNKELARV